jgi:hypothetical protein
MSDNKKIKMKIGRCNDFFTQKMDVIYVKCGKMIYDVSYGFRDEILKKLEVSRMLTIVYCDKKIMEYVDIILKKCSNLKSIKVTVNDDKYLADLYQVIDKYNIENVHIIFLETAKNSPVGTCNDIINKHYNEKTIKLEFMKCTRDYEEIFDLISMYEEYGYNIKSWIKLRDYEMFYKFEDLVMSYKYNLKYIEAGNVWNKTELREIKYELIRCVIILREVLDTGCLLYVKDFL